MAMTVISNDGTTWLPPRDAPCDVSLSRDVKAVKVRIVDLARGFLAFIVRMGDGRQPNGDIHIKYEWRIDSRGNVISDLP